MKFARITFVMPLLFCLSACQTGTDKKNNLQPKKNIIPATELEKSEKSPHLLNQKESIRQQPEKEVKKKKLKAIDTLRPVQAIP